MTEGAPGDTPGTLPEQREIPNAADHTLTSLLLRGAEHHGDRPAVYDDSGRWWSYAELNDRANRVANALRTKGVGRGDRVGIWLPKSLASVAAVHGILRAGAAYVPVDATAPPERNRFILENCGARVILTDEPGYAAWTTPGDASERDALVYPGTAPEVTTALWIEEADDAPPDHLPGSQDLAYILYTSGSTGKPKGVVHTHASGMSFVAWCAQSLGVRPDDRFSSHAPFHFDLSILDLYVPLTGGASITLVGEDLGKSPRLLAEFIAARRLSVWYSVPSILAMLAQHGRLEDHDYSSLRLILFAGEVFPIQHLHMLQELLPDPTYWNLYGPTETNVCTAYQLPAPEPDRSTPYPIGPACGNVRAVVLDEDHETVPAGGEGLLYIHASGPVMSEYWGRPDLTENAFHVDAAGDKWYHTGDVVTTDAEGNYEYVGRQDRMVKRRGYRVELGEIEAALYRHSEIREAAAVAQQTERGVIVWAHLAAQDGPRPSLVDLKQFCAKHLPSYMNPDRFVFHERLPRTSTDKVDYQALTAPS